LKQPSTRSKSHASLGPPSIRPRTQLSKRRPRAYSSLA
jgi:hypothetical protein